MFFGGDNVAINADNVALIKKYILHETLLAVLEIDKKAIETSSVKIKEPYLCAIDNAVKTAVSKTVEIKRQMNMRRVKVLTTKNTDYGTEVKYAAKGYECGTEFWGGSMRAEVWVLMNRYMFGKEQENG